MIAEFAALADLLIDRAWSITDNSAVLALCQWPDDVWERMSELEDQMYYIEGHSAEITAARRRANAAYAKWNRLETLRVAIIAAESNAIQGREAMAHASRYF